MLRRIFYSVIILALILSIIITFPPKVLAESNNYEFLGFSGYVTSQTELETTIDIMKSENLNTYRVSFKPSWQALEGSFRGYNSDFIDYLLSNTNFFVIVDGNHLYPATEETASEARNHWTEVKDRIFLTLERYSNNPRVAVELINEYTSNDYHTRIQSLIDEIRNASYTNPIVTNKWKTAWDKFNDPLNNTYQGMHFYFNTWNPTNAIDNLKLALSGGIDKIINTEIGASDNEYKDYSQTNVANLKLFLEQCKEIGINNCLWMNTDAVNWQQGYTQYALALREPNSQTITPFSITIPTSSPAYSLSPAHKPTPIPTSKPTPTSLMTVSPTSPNNTPHGFDEVPTNDPRIIELSQAYTLVIACGMIAAVIVVASFLILKAAQFKRGLKQ